MPEIEPRPVERFALAARRSNLSSSCVKNLIWGFFMLPSPLQLLKGGYVRLDSWQTTKKHEEIRALIHLFSKITTISL